MKRRSQSGLLVKSKVKAGGPMNHNRVGLKVKSNVKAGSKSPMNHNRVSL